jgi:uncharacterized membrane protein YfcA
MEKQKNKPMEIATLIAVGLVAGIVSGLIGVGGGIVIVPALVFFFGYSQQLSQGTSLAMMIPPVGILAVMQYYKKGHVDLRLAGLLCIGFVAGAWVGSKLAVSMPEGVLKKVYGVILVLIAIRLIFFSK